PESLLAMRSPWMPPISVAEFHRPVSLDFEFIPRCWNTTLGDWATRRPTLPCSANYAGLMALFGSPPSASAAPAIVGPLWAAGNPPAESTDDSADGCTGRSNSLRNRLPNPARMRSYSSWLNSPRSYNTRKLDRSSPEVLSPEDGRLS